MNTMQSFQALLADPNLIELIINSDGTVYVERKGNALEKLPGAVSVQEAEALLEMLMGKTEPFGPKRPYADLSARDGSRVHVMAPPLTTGGLCINIRKRPQRRIGLEDLVKNLTLPSACASFLRFAVQQHKNILIVGGASSGKTTLLNALAAEAFPQERILVLEDTPELFLPQPHVTYLKTRTRDAQGLPDVTLRDLLINTLRMRPDRIIVGEVRDVEAADLLSAMNVGHEGMLSTLHSNSPREGLQRLETLVISSGINLPLRAVRANMALAVDLVVFLARMADGARRVCQVTELTGIEMETITLSDLFVMESRKSPTGDLHHLRPTGARPKFYDQLRVQGVPIPMDFFQP